ncbi:MAG: cell wall-binding repeat-containing protein [Coriobacteriia bacterium]|nr:cell wall-binding repeat-containing protein [Coriobacteriia bacterium]
MRFRRDRSFIRRGSHESATGRSRWLTLALCAALALPFVAGGQAGAAFLATGGSTDIASVSTGGAPGNRVSEEAVLSADGNLVVFNSFATNLGGSVGGTYNNVFLRDRLDGQTTCVSLNALGQEPTYGASEKDISADGRYVTFASAGGNLVEGTTDDFTDIFVRDTSTGEITCVSVTSAGAAADEGSWGPSISADGRYVAFNSSATNFEAGNPFGNYHVYVHDRNTGETKRASVSSAGAVGDSDSQGARISANGRFVAFYSSATNLVPHDTNDRDDIFVRDLLRGTTTRVSMTWEGEESNGTSDLPEISADGRYVVFESSATNMTDDVKGPHRDVFVHDRRTNNTELVSVATDGTPSDDSANEPAISADGRYVTFQSMAGNLVSGDTNGAQDVFVRDLLDKKTVRVSVSSLGMQAGGSSFGPSISGDGRVIAFHSTATNLLAAPTTGQQVFFRQRAAEPVIPVEGSNRYATAIAASKKAYPNGLDSAGARTVVIATGRNWPDALGGTSLAGALDGPVLLVDTNSVPGAVMTELDRLDAAKVMIVGGTAAVGAGVESALKTKLGPGNVYRLDGADRYKTADAVAAKVLQTLDDEYDGTAFVATGVNFPDALAAAPLAARQGWPLYLAHPGSGLSAATKAAMGDVDRVVILGGDAVVTPATETYLKGRFGADNVERLGGGNRYATAVAVAEYAVGRGHVWNLVGVTTGDNFPDALAGGIVQGKAGSVMLLTGSDVLSTPTSAALVSHKSSISTVTFFGGAGAVSPAVRTAVGNALK